MKSISEFYKDKRVFITGATGFIGKVLVEKLLRSSPDIDKIYLLIRPKKGQNCEQRLHRLIQSKPISFTLDSNKIQQKLIAIEGDISEARLGLKDTDYKHLLDNINVIFHVAGDVNFKETIREVITHNLIGTKHIMDLCKQCLHLEVLVHVSTAYAFCQKTYLEEKIYPMNISPQEVIEAVNTMSDKKLENYIKPRMEGRPNYYTFTKALAEHVVLAYRPDNLPVAIVRPSIVLPSYKEPLPGWIDNFNGAVGFGILGALGIGRIYDYEPEKRLNLIPVDMTSNALIASAWHLATTRPKAIEIYHLASNPDHTPTVFSMIKSIGKVVRRSPSIRTIRPHSGIPETRPNRLRLWLTIYVSHYMFAYFFDAIFRLLRHKPRLVSATHKMNMALEILSYFYMKQWVFHKQNTTKLIEIVKQNSENDWLEYQFDVTKVDWNILCESSWLGCRKYLLKESEDNVPAAKKRLKKLIYGYRIFLFFWYSLIIYIFYWIISKIII